MTESGQGKRCPDCAEHKPLHAYRRNAARPDGLAFYCTDCFRRRDQAAYERKRLREGRRVRRLDVLPEGHKRCAACEQVKPFVDFHAAGRGQGQYPQCKPCRKEQSRGNHLLRTYGLDSATLQQLVDAQGGVCAVCRQAAPVHVDHDHVSGRVRGVLCFNCNGGLGQFKDRAGVMRSAIDYLERTTWQKERARPGVYRLTSPRQAAARSSSSSELQRLISSRRG